ncbi:hypothetical protein D6C78_02669 [Aureobasidium pullulans]|uniref:HpcH/HpaI aldolase/citrate lyase domain-containing protein n=1 Tax=Aureobasidium pullulans TaxID=5580 RepID=A0A4T0C612_AURPU|nr:hypothetical protein D6C78_02669 [Aureobasidium pullulans]
MISSQPLTLANSVRERLPRNEVPYTLSVKLIRSVELPTTAKTAGFDGILIDMEHSSFDLDTTGQLCTAALYAGIPLFLKQQHINSIIPNVSSQHQHHIILNVDNQLDHHSESTLSSGSIVETSTITSKISGSGFGTTTTSLSQTSTTTGIPVVTNGQCKGSDCTDGECTGILLANIKPDSIIELFLQDTDGEPHGFELERFRRDGQLEAESNDSDFSKLDNPLAKRADVVGDALSCPYSPPAQDTYCTYFGLSKRANAAKEINLPWASALKWSNYPQCPNTGTKGITQVPKFYHPAGASTAQNGIQNYDPTSSQSASTNGRIAGIAQSDFANDHVFEAQLISGFLSWLCGQPSVTGYTQIPWPAGWTQPDTTWCAAVFGSDADAQSGFLFPAFPGDNTGDNNFLGNCAEVTGGVSQPTLMAVYYGPANGWKGKITKAQWPAFSSLSGTVAQQQEQAGVVIRDTANVFQYLRDATIQDAWTTPSKSVETVCVQFDNNFWGSTSAANAPGTALDGPASPQGVANWGMRTMWAYWIDNHLYKIEQQVPSWVILALGKVGGAGGGFARSYMQANGMVSASQMHFPLDANSPNAPIPGTQGSATSTVSRYMMWDGATHGALGL